MLSTREEIVVTLSDEVRGSDVAVSVLDDLVDTLLEQSFLRQDEHRVSDDGG